jgi:sterol desaturase/sphingolipid hydroxylase (fatty acid hydroxylase superfamily)/DNA-binding beta-propeller fold protein YncE
MEWMSAIAPLWLSTLLWMLGLAVVFGVLARLTPCNPGMYWWRDLRAVITDFMYWFVVPLFIRICRLTMLLAGIVFLFGGREPHLLPVSDLPLWQQCLAILLIQDVMMYWIHRLFHTGWAWKVHAVHHSPRVLDWMSASRFHPLNSLLSYCVPDVTVLLLGFSPEALAVLVPVNVIWSSMVHANLNWSFGPLRYLLASPVFHRWHHTTGEEGLNKNFAPTFPFLDMIFGTFHMPPGKLPEEFGTGEPDFPEGFWGQLIHPFRPAPQPAGIPVAPRRRIMKAAAIIAVLGMLGGGTYLLARLSSQNKELAREVEKANRREHALQLDLATRALADNDLVRAGSLLDEAAGALGQTTEYRHLREQCHEKCQCFTGHARAVLAVAISPDGSWIASAGEDGTIKVWDVATAKEKHTIKASPRPIRSVAISPDGKHVLVGCSDGTVRVWNAQTGKLQRELPGHTTGVLSVTVSADGKHIFSGSGDMTARLIDAATGRKELALTDHIGAVLSVATSSDGSRVIRATGSMAKLWNVASAREEWPLRGHRDLVYTVAITPDGLHVATGSLDTTVKVWDVATMREEATLRGHSGAVYSVAMSDDGARIVSGSQDQTVKVWNVQTAREELTLRGHTDSVTSVALTADGQRIVSASRDGTIKLWDIRKCRPTRTEQATAQLGR